ncbi:hypothetical protein EMGBS4_08390 [Acidimicrobiaceae bacterium]|nr:hypothetical protein EMGBS4_08390 [Acidimicrobiaceae bacterium]
MLVSSFVAGVLILAGLAPQNLSACKLVAPIGAAYNATISDPFRQPRCDRCAGNRGIDYATQPGTPIVAGASGIVSYFGVVANKKYLVIRTAAGRRLTYGSISTSDLRIGDFVVAGQIIATTTTTLYFGVRESRGGNSAGAIATSDIYVDPAKYLAQNTDDLRHAVLISGIDSGSKSVDLDSSC